MQSNVLLKPVTAKDPEPDPRTDGANWIGWFRRTQVCVSLNLMKNIRETRRREWDTMDKLSATVSR